MLLALAATAAVLFASASPLLAGHLALDRDCAPILEEQHDHDAHRLSAASAPEADHCAACHLARSARGAGLAGTVLPQDGTRKAATTPLAAARTPHVLQTDYTRGPPR